MKLNFCILGLVAMMSAGAAGISEQFSAVLFDEVARENKGQSVILSPLVVLLPLAALSQAAEGESRDEIIRAIGMRTSNETLKRFSSLAHQLESVKGVELKVANRVYLAKDAILNKNFAETSKQAFDLDYKKIDFLNKEVAVNKINSWVEDQTDHKIKDLLNPNMVDSFTRAVLLNVIYFKGTWLNKFNSHDTRDLEFYVTKDKTVKVPTMKGTFDLKYTESQELDAKLLSMPYAGNEASFLIVLPNQIDGISNLQEKLRDASLLGKTVKQMYQGTVEVTIPKFKIETTIPLTDILTKMGIKKIFSPNANLQNLLENENIFINQAIQKAFIEVNEDGVKAAAANSFNWLGPRPSVYFVNYFHANRPFVFYLMVEGNILFSGVYSP